jgi:hypothetical protein
MARWDKERGIVRIERTKALAEASAKVELGIDALPASWENVQDLVEHLVANVKSKRVQLDGSTAYFFPNTGKPDHLHHAKAYCDVALTILPPAPSGREDDSGDELPGAGEGRYYTPRSVPGGSLRGML